MKPDYKTAVDKADLEKSASERAYWLAKWGFEATSMWYLNPIHNKSLDAVVEDTLAEGSYPKHNFNCRDGALPQSSPIVAERLIKFFTDKGEIVASPFIERLPHLLIANYLGRHAIGQDLSKLFYQHDVEKVKRRLLQNASLDPDNNKILVENDTQFTTTFNGMCFDIRNGDSRNLSWIPDNYVDFVMNSPPYYNTITAYGDEPEQLGYGKKTSYEEFLKGLQQVYAECYRVTKPGKFHAVILNDFRMGEIFYTYHADILPYMKEIGWKVHDCIVYNLSLHPLQAIFTSQLARDHHMAKQHEVIWIFRKPV
jgi:hypothetical protein